MARPISTTHQAQRDTILDRAAECFAHASYAATSMNDIAAACGTSKARLYHYYPSKEALLMDLLLAYTDRLLLLVGQSHAAAQRQQLSDRAALHDLLRRFLREYERSANRHKALLHDTPFLSDAPGPDGQPSPRQQVLDRQRDVVAATTRLLKAAFPQRVQAHNQAALTMMLFGMINWTFTWLRPDGPISYEAFADEVMALLEKGLAP